jgi:5-(carboxyamino)imidazole ribonucleotide synthase
MINEDFISKRVGIIGGGQLGKMMINEATKMGIFTAILDPSEDCPASCLANEKIVASFDDKEALLELAKKVDVLTCEFEHISTDALKVLEEKGYNVYPKSSSLKVIQNKYNQKKELQKYNIPLGDFIEIKKVHDIELALEKFGYPAMLKSALGGYDGKGNSLIKTKKDIIKAFTELKGDIMPLYLEKYIPYVKEISVLCCIGGDKEIAIYPVAENVHKDSILFETSVPSAISSSVEEKAKNIAREVCKIFDTAGILCIEMFLTEDEEVLVNEVAPRPHNSGHYTIEGCITSQFENHIRAIVGLPLGKTDLIIPTVMRNILGEPGYNGETFVEGAYEALKVGGTYLHVYGKSETKPYRKMGHLTAVGETVEQAKERALEASKYIKVISK